MRSQDNSIPGDPQEARRWKGGQGTFQAAGYVLLLDLSAGFIDVLTL